MNIFILYSRDNNQTSGYVCNVYLGFQGLCTLLYVYETSNQGTHDKLNQI